MEDTTQLKKSITNLNTNVETLDLAEIIANAKDILLLASMIKNKQPIAPRSEKMGYSEVSTFKKRVAIATRNKDLEALERVADDLINSYPNDPVASIMHQEILILKE